MNCKAIGLLPEGCANRRENRIALRIRKGHYSSIINDLLLAVNGR